MTVSGGLKDSKVTLQQERILKNPNKPVFGVVLVAGFFLILQCDYVKTSGF